MIPSIYALADNLCRIFKTLGNLKAQDIIKRNPEKKYFSIHRLIKAWIMQRMDEERWQSSFGKVVDLLYDKYPRQNMGMPLHSSHKICDTFLPHVLSVASNLRNPEKQSYADKLIVLLHNATWLVTHDPRMNVLSLLILVGTCSKEAGSRISYHIAKSRSNF